MAMETIQIGGLTLEFMHSKADTDGSLDMFKMTVQPNAKVPAPHYHERWDEVVYGLTGTLTWTVEGTPFRIGRGQSKFIKRGEAHGFKNESQEPAACLSIMTPAVLGTAYFRELAALLSTGGPPDVEKMKDIMRRYGLVPVMPT
jgi:quercetin dioxygenase-like cupin family protein